MKTKQGKINKHSIEMKKRLYRPLKAEKHIIRDFKRLLLALSYQNLRRTRYFSRAGFRRYLLTVKTDLHPRTIIDFAKNHRPSQRTVEVIMVALVVLSPLLDYAAISPLEKVYALNDKTEALIGGPVEKFADSLELDRQTGIYFYNRGYNPAGEVGGLSGRPNFTAQLHEDAQHGGIEAVDPVNNVSIKLLPQQESEQPGRNENRIIYPLKEQNAKRIYSLSAASIKEDIVLEEYISDYVSYEYILELPSGLEARLENDGSIGVYGVSPLLLGNATASSESDAQLLEDARKNGQKALVSFSKIIVPSVVEA